MPDKRMSKQAEDFLKQLEGDQYYSDKAQTAEQWKHKKQGKKGLIKNKKEAQFDKEQDDDYYDDYGYEE